MPDLDFAKAVEGGVEVLVLVQPRASRTKVLGLHDGRLKIALAAPPVDGEANDALVAFLADTLQLKRSAVTLLDGATGRRKRLRLMGTSLDVVLARVAPVPK
ncbi:MAG: DUF167 domain-containing protein [Archangium sp.]|nr:DUF167 domain-containing protein [Archangium sp.]